MIDRAKVEAYDRFWKNRNSPEMALGTMQKGFWKKTTILKPLAEEPAHEKEYDIFIAGAGPSGTLAGAYLAYLGHSVLLVDRTSYRGCGSTWNLSHDEFGDLSDIPVLTKDQWQSLIVGDYNEGVFRLFDSSGEKAQQRESHFDEILNISMDEDRFFELLSETKGLKLKLGCCADLTGTCRQGAFIRCSEKDAEYMVKARLFIDARGWTSPLAENINAHRTVESWYNMIGVHTAGKRNRFTSETTGKVIGLICATYKDEIETKAGKVQPILERFTDYVEAKSDNGDVIYYFTRTDEPTELAPMFDDLLKEVPYVMTGFSEDMVDKTYFGHAAGYYQPGLFSGRTHQTSAGDRTLFVGVAAMQYSGLTGCAFGALARNAKSICEDIDKALRKNNLRYSRLNKIDIDRRERASQWITDLFAGSMALQRWEKPGSVNRDWLALIDAADQIEPSAKNEMFRDKIRLSVLNRMLLICAKTPHVIAVLLRNNRDHVRTIIATFIRSYTALMLLEIKMLAVRRRLLYAKGLLGGIWHAPAYFINTMRLLFGARNQQRRKKLGAKGSA